MILFVLNSPLRGISLLKLLVAHIADEIHSEILRRCRIVTTKTEIVTHEGLLKRGAWRVGAVLLPKASWSQQTSLLSTFPAFTLFILPPVHRNDPSFPVTL